MRVGQPSVLVRPPRTGAGSLDETLTDTSADAGRDLECSAHMRYELYQEGKALRGCRAARERVSAHNDSRSVGREAFRPSSETLRAPTECTLLCPHQT